MSSYLNENKPVVVTRVCSVDTNIPDTYRLLSDTALQLKWNTQWSEARQTPEGEVKNGFTLTLFFKSGERAQYIMTNVIPDSQFTYFSQMKVLGWFHLGDVFHTFNVVEKNGKTEITQKVLFEPKGMGTYVKGSIIKSYIKRMEKIFEDFLARSSQPLEHLQSA